MGARIVVADDHALMRGGIKDSIEMGSPHRIIGEAANGLEAVNLCSSLKPDLVLMDVRMPVMDGREATRLICRLPDRPMVMAVSMCDDTACVQGMFASGARGFVTKDVGHKELLHAVDQMLHNGYHVPEEFMGMILDRVAGEQSATVEAWPSTLTTREMTILSLTAQGKSVRDMGVLLNISTQAIYASRCGLMKKLQVEGLPQLKQKAMEYSRMQEQGAQSCPK